jgi:hypothetical protein
MQQLANIFAMLAQKAKDAADALGKSGSSAQAMAKDSQAFDLAPLSQAIATATKALQKSASGLKLDTLNAVALATTKNLNALPLPKTTMNLNKVVLSSDKVNKSLTDLAAAIIESEKFQEALANQSKKAVQGLNEIVKSSGILATNMGQMGSAVQSMGQVAKQANIAANNLARLSENIAGSKEAAEAEKDVADSSKEASAELKKIAADAAGAAKGLSYIGVAAGAAFTGVGKSVSALMTGPLAVAGVATGAFTGLVNVIGKFVGALNPALMEQLQMAFDDLFAVVGRALVPVMGAVIPIVRTFADALVPVVEGMKPAMEALANTLITMAVPFIQLFASALNAVTPFVTQFANAVSSAVGPLIDQLLPVISSLVPVYGAIFAGLSQLLPVILSIVGELFAAVAPLVEILAAALVPIISLVASALKSFGEALKTLVGWIAWFTRKSANALLGETGPTRLKPVATNPGASLGAAARQTNFTSFEEFARSLIVASFGSGAGDADAKTAENTHKIVELMERAEARENNKFAALPVGRELAGAR